MFFKLSNLMLNLFILLKQMKNKVLILIIWNMIMLISVNIYKALINAIILILK